MDLTRDTMTRLADAAEIPSIAAAVLVEGTCVLNHAVGLARRDPRQPATPHTAYDLASVTKVVGTVPVVADLMDRGHLDLDQPVRDTLPDVEPGITARHLLSHSAGYPAWAPLYALEPAGPHRRERILARARQTPLEHAPGMAHRYSDLGYLTLCALLETLGGDQLDTLLRCALGEHELRWGWPNAAATEACPVRQAVVQGEVHDLNCAAMGGVSTHAGLFGSALAVARLAERLLEGLGGLGPWGHVLPDLAQAGPGSHRLGFDGISAGYSSTGHHFPPDTVGHLGYTGTSVWIVPSRQTVVVFLTNRVHPTDDLTAIRAARPVLHDAVAADLGWDRTPSGDTAPS